MIKINGLFIGDIGTLEPGGDRTGIFKYAVQNVSIRAEGLAGDHQADRRYHGGPNKAVHQYAARSYELIGQAFPHLEDKLTAGAMGENLSASCMDDENVFIGDIYRVGTALLQVSEPRRPCWKINAKFSAPELSQFVESTAITGWYYRVIETGEASIGDAVSLHERYPGNPSIAAFTRTVTQHRPDINELKHFITSPGLSELWRHKLQGRLKFLEQQGSR